MTKVQNNRKPGKVFYLLFLFLAIQLPVISQNLILEPEVRMLSLGDSYTIGESVELVGRWPHQFLEQLRTKGIHAPDPDYIATTGWTTADLLEGMGRDLNKTREYNLVSILIGVNNQYQGMDRDLYEPDLRLIVDKALEVVGGLSSRVFMLSIPDYAYTPFGAGEIRISKEIDKYNEIARSIAMEYGIPFFNITPISRKGLSETSLVAADRLHPSAAQYNAWVEELLSSDNICFQDDSADFREIKSIFYQQEVDWNKGDIDAFMEAYWNSDDLQFGGAQGITKGWQNTLERYKIGYPDRRAMGKLSFQIKDMTRHSPEVVSLTGSWKLSRAKDQPGGHFLLIWRKIEGEWKIVVDHTSQKVPE